MHIVASSERDKNSCTLLCFYNVNHISKGIDFFKLCYNFNCQINSKDYAKITRIFAIYITGPPLASLSDKVCSKVYN